MNKYCVTIAFRGQSIGDIVEARSPLLAAEKFARKALNAETNLRAVKISKDDGWIRNPEISTAKVDLLGGTKEVSSYYYFTE